MEPIAAMSRPFDDFPIGAIGRGSDKTTFCALSTSNLCRADELSHGGVRKSAELWGAMRLVDKVGSSTMPPIAKKRGSRDSKVGGWGLLSSALLDPPHHHPCSKVCLGPSD